MDSSFVGVVPCWLYLQLVVEDEVAREGRVVVEQSGVFAKLNPDKVICLHRQYQCLAARSVTSSTVAVYWHLYNQRLFTTICNWTKLHESASWLINPLECHIK